MHLIKKHGQSAITAALFCIGLLPAQAAETGITIEAVDAYSCGALSNDIPNVDNFRTRMLSIGGYTAGLRYVNGLVYPTDFTDPQVLSGGADTFNFDRTGDAIAYFSGHGTCDDQTNTACTTNAGCPTVAGLQKQCLRFTDSPLTGRCVYSRPRNIVVDKTGSSCQLVNYSTGGVRWGEDPTAGTWAGAGTNGGINLAIIDNSCGITPGMYIPQLLKTFAGVSSIALIMPTRVGSDTADVANRGRAFADRYVANVNSAVGPSWTSAINSVTGGSSCAFGGGSHGVVGCGAHIYVSLEVNQARAEWANRTESWVQLRNEANDGIGSGWMSWLYTCNYDCNNHPFFLP
ncbi:hypothetical protein [Chitinimonas sp. BJB300]|uniref:hypothetical protein n=1 Tax=Chitinimonas sp. BJB300 TaxID=1559339 RepID=UPI000C0CC15B|nr:hypothetical protein [Chitinimonas sp. BJB300]PHV12969.1 hypothetical protein CSQ89_03060 [Chitinimonas sp. BJB300]TSJ89078.1 hypothetical protein FG002_009400 [Chitinimonas sp. BJB300]